MSKNLPWFSNQLISWYLQNKRHLPWREIDDPYTIWLSEIILQQTRVAQGLPYFEKFIDQFPTVFDLAHANEEKVLKLWQGLGYYSRARNLHYTAKQVAFGLDGIFPKDHKGLLKLKGVGDYTASAIASICYNEPTAVVDGNVYRVLSRVFGIPTPINSTKGIVSFKKLAQSLIDTSQPGAFNQAIMEFGARFCVPQNPNCNDCIFNTKCVAFKENRVGQLPAKLKNAKVKKEYFNYLVCVTKDGKTLLEQRTGQGIWRNLYQFPLIESIKKWNKKSLINSIEFIELSKKINIQSITIYNEEEIIHKLSHKHLHTTFWILETEDILKDGISFTEIHSFPVPVLIENFISNFEPFKK